MSHLDDVVMPVLRKGASSVEMTSAGAWQRTAKKWHNAKDAKTKFGRLGGPILERWKPQRRNENRLNPLYEQALTRRRVNWRLYVLLNPPALES